MIATLKRREFITLLGGAAAASSARAAASDAVDGVSSSYRRTLRHEYC
jgi:hypothetical protein